MKSKHLLAALCCALSLTSASLHAADTVTPDLGALALPGAKGWTLLNLEANSVEHAGQKAVRLAVKDRKAAGGEGTGGVAYLDGVELAEGTVEFSAFGESNGGFGVCFGGQDLLTHEAVYFRPYAFASTLTSPGSGKFLEGRDDAVQYVAHPGNGWHKLRTGADTGGAYEKPVAGPKPGEWFRARVVITAAKVEAFVNEEPKPCLSVARLHPGRTGMVGLWVGNGAPGYFSELRITPAEAPPGAASTNAEPIKPELKVIPSGKGWKGDTAKAKLLDKDGAPAIEVAGEAVIWLEGFEFTDGVIEFDGKGRSGPPQSNFMGIVFRVVDEKTHDVVYFRPFNFRADTPEKKSHAVQYASHPGWPWPRLRQEKTGQYEKAIEPAPDGDAWFHAKVVVQKPKVSVFVNGASEPSLVVNELTERNGGSVGLYFYASGAIANLKITPKQ